MTDGTKASYRVVTPRRTPLPPCPSNARPTETAHRGAQGRCRRGHAPLATGTPRPDTSAGKSCPSNALSVLAPGHARAVPIPPTPTRAEGPPPQWAAEHRGPRHPHRPTPPRPTGGCARRVCPLRWAPRASCAACRRSMSGPTRDAPLARRDNHSHLATEVGVGCGRPGLGRPGLAVRVRLLRRAVRVGCAPCRSAGGHFVTARRGCSRHPGGGARGMVLAGAREMRQPRCLRACTLRVAPDGVWRSLVARPLWERKAVGSNPATPTTCAITSRGRTQ